MIIPKLGWSDCFPLVSGQLTIMSNNITMFCHFTVLKSLNGKFLWRELTAITGYNCLLRRLLVQMLTLVFSIVK